MANITIVCLACGVQEGGRGNRAKYCRSCGRDPRIFRRSSKPEDVAVGIAGRVRDTPAECVKCGSEFSRIMRTQTRCADCSRAHRNWMTQRWREENPQPSRGKRPLGTVQTCPICQENFAKSANYQTYCSGCRPRIRKFREQLDAGLKVRHSLSQRLAKAIRRRKSGPSWSTYFGYSVQDFVAHIERQFLKGMSWENYGYRGWHIDHIVPVAAFDMSSDEDVRRCFALTNLRPLWGKQNQSKRDQRLYLI